MEPEFLKSNIISAYKKPITATEFQHKLTQTEEGRAKLAAMKAEGDYKEASTVSPSVLAQKENEMLKAKAHYEDTKKSYSLIEKAFLALTGNDPIDWAKQDYEIKQQEYREALTMAAAEDEKQAEDYEKRLKKTGNWGEYLGNAAWAGVNRIGQNFASTIHAVNDLLGLENTGYGKWFTKQKNDIDAYMENLQNKTMYAGLAVGDKHQIANGLIQGTISALPDAVMIAATTVATGGTNVAVTAAKTISTAAAQAGTKTTVLKAAGTALKNIAKNPFTYTSIIQSYGSTYDEALAGGATNEEALLTATISSLLNAVVEVGGDTGNAGIQSLPKALQETKGVWGKVCTWVKSSLSEGKEEVIQSVITNLTQALVYDNDKKLYSTEDTDAIINPKELLKEGTMGTAIGAVIGGGQITFDAIINAPNNKQLKAIGKQAMAQGDISGIINYAKNSIDSDIRATAIKASEGAATDMEAGTLYSYAYKDIAKTLENSESYEAMCEAYKNIVLQTESPAVRNIASSIYVTKTMEALDISQNEARMQADILAQKTNAEPGVDGVVKNGYNVDERGGINGREELLYNGSGQAGEQNADTQSRLGAVQEAVGGVYSSRETVGKNGYEILGDRGDTGRVALTAEQNERLRNTAIKNEDGTPKPVYHFTENMEFDTFAKGDTGFHFGNADQAAQRGRSKGQSGRVITAYLDIQNPVRMNADIMNWQPNALALKLWADGLITKVEEGRVNQLAKQSGVGYDSPAAVELRRILAEKGYDGVVYPNGFEGDGDSYIAFYPEQVIITDNGIQTNKQADQEGSAFSMPKKGILEVLKDTVSQKIGERMEKFWNKYLDKRSKMEIDDNPDESLNENSKQNIQDYITKSTCDRRELYQYLTKNVDVNAADTFMKKGIWPPNLCIPKDPSVLTPDGEIDWNKAAEGGYKLDANGDAIKEKFIPKVGEIVDRYGNANGRYTSPVVDEKPYSYAERSLPYIEDISVYHQYEVIGDFSKIKEYVDKCPNTKLKQDIINIVIKYYYGNYSDLVPYKGEIAKIEGWGTGGGIQYEFPLTIEQLEQLGLLKEIKPEG